MLGIAGVLDLAAQRDRAWMQAAERALAGNANTFAAVPVTNLLKPGGQLATFAARGYDVQAPGDAEFPWQP